MIGATVLIATLPQATLTGVVRDSVDLEPIAFAQVAVTSVGGEMFTASGVSDRFGAFVVPGVPAAGPLRVEVGAFGYALWARTYAAPPSEPVRVLLSPAPISLEGLEVAVSGRPGDPLSVSRDAFVIDSVLIRSLPTILETDVLRAVAVSPSASAASDYASVPLIRGGTSDGTPVLLDGVRLSCRDRVATDSPSGRCRAPSTSQRGTVLATGGGWPAQWASRPPWRMAGARISTDSRWR